MSLVLQSSGGGQITIQEPATASNFTVTLPAATGTTMVTGNMPAASVYMASNMDGVSSDVFTKVQFNTKVFDTATCFNNTGSTATLNGLSVPSYSFCPNVAGYYQVTMNMDYFGVIGGLNITQQIYKNGTNTNMALGEYCNIASQAQWSARVSGLDFANGTTVSSASECCCESAVVKVLL
jgi:hypothetical protein